MTRYEIVATFEGGGTHTFRTAHLANAAEHYLALVNAEGGKLVDVKFNEVVAEWNA